MNAEWIAPCGLYCGICPDNIETGICHGCGCHSCDCAAGWHHDHCLIHRCVEERGLAGCWACDELPCTQLTQFCVDPVWRTHLPVIENLRRIARIGPEPWLAEQAEYWSNDRYRQRWLRLYAECSRKQHEWTANKD
jgi:hypothetical protein